MGRGPALCHVCIQHSQTGVYWLLTARAHVSSSPCSTIAKRAVPSRENFLRRTMDVLYLSTHIPILHGQAIESIQKVQARQKRFDDKTKNTKMTITGRLVMRRNMEKQTFPRNAELVRTLPSTKTTKKEHLSNQEAR
ncbi:hypothetical protein BDB00DRAFT_885667 [Zychaea mexicana]|uniref:uncharacterized protein n=1 Tax=Zychaea mexicana TaxID=64656 RepID=UPI0022FE61E7|nr:uncharacterized protein BDB00DRAFT_885667 [Zychaea mexicana]KAI9499439.1 hypothetical protein BDB00DRAFT_885667 [Zychaea mexicana]